MQDIDRIITYQYVISCWKSLQFFLKELVWRELYVIIVSTGKGEQIWEKVFYYSLPDSINESNLKIKISMKFDPRITWASSFLFTQDNLPETTTEASFKGTSIFNM